MLKKLIFPLLCFFGASIFNVNAVASCDAYVHVKNTYFPPGLPYGPVLGIENTGHVNHPEDIESYVIKPYEIRSICGYANEGFYLTLYPYPETTAYLQLIVNYSGGHYKLQTGMHHGNICMEVTNPDTFDVSITYCKNPSKN